MWYYPLNPNKLPEADDANYADWHNHYRECVACNSSQHFLCLIWKYSHTLYILAEKIRKGL